jgi:hypothetical protein
MVRIEEFVPLRRCIPAITVIGAIAAIAFVERPSRVVAQSAGLVAAYGFSEGVGTTVADLSGHSITGTIVGASWTTAGKYGNALSFNGSSSYVDLGNPAALQITGSMTLEAWIKSAGNPPDDGQIVAQSSGLGWQLKTSPDTGPRTFGIQVTGTSGTNAQRYSTTVPTLNAWYHIAGVFDAAAGTLSTYVNGVLDNGILRNAVPTVQVDQAINVNIGRRSGGFYFNGIIDEVRIYNRALSQSEILTDMSTPVGGTPPPPDTTPPTISITSPLDGANVAGTTNITVAASDDVGVASVQYLLDGANLSTPVATAPFTLPWNSATTTIGPHTLAAIAKDYSNNATTSATISVTVSNPSPTQVGQWSPVLNWPQTGLGIPLVGVHASLLPSGNVLTWSDYSDNAGAQIFNPSTHTFSDATFSPVSLFCSAHAFLADGRLLVAGGIVGLQDDLGPQQSETFDSTTGTWTPVALMNTGRYYPTTTTLPDGRVLVQGGTTTCLSCNATTPEIYDPVANKWTQMAAGAKMTFHYYPHPFVLPDGRVIVAGEDDAAISTKVLDLNTQTWTTIDSRIIDGHSSAMYQPGKILKAGTATADDPGKQSAATSYILDMTQPSPSWQATGPMAYPRSFLNLTLLPDGTVLATGGGTTTDPADHSKAVYPAEIWSPITKTWTTMASMLTPRQYHSTALLLPDATVLVAGGGRQNGRSQPDPADEPNSEIFSPPYLFKGPRPVITSAPSKLLYGAPFSVVTPDDARIASVSLIALGSVTHAFNENQRFVPLTFTDAGGSLSVTAPVDGNTAPPGPYMLFIVDTNGVPSVAAMVRLPAPSEDMTPPTAPGNLTATASIGSVKLAWLASTDNVGVTAYNVHRSTTSGFTPTAANRIGQTAATIYTDTAITAAGTYYYVVTAQDARANISTPSNEAPATVALDTTPPTVSMTAPAAGATVIGVVTVTASASDDVGVAGVQFYLDGTTPIGTEVTGPGPNYTFNWATTPPLNGAHTLSARARDGAGNMTMSSAIAINVANPANLVVAYSFNEGTGTTVTDLSGNNLNGTVVNATWTAAGKFGSALSFNGSTSYVDLGNPTALKMTGSMTLEAWIKAAANPADDGQIIAKSDGTGWQLKTTPDTGPQTFGVQVMASSGTAGQRYSTTVRSLNTWYHIAAVYNATAGTLSTYVNGVLDNGTLRNTVPTAQVDAAVNVNIGRRTGGFYFNGIIDEVRIYSRALSQPEIQIDMTTPVGGAPPPSDLTVASTHAGTFNQGQTGVYTLAVANSGSGPTSGIVTVTDAVPVGLTATAMSGTGWTCNLATTTCTRSDAIFGGTSYPPVTLSVNIAGDASATVTNTATVSGGAESNTANDVSNDITTITVPDTTPPVIALTSPLQGALVTNTVAVAATATDNVGVAGVQFLLDGANLGAEVTGPGPNYSVNWNTTTAQNATHTLSARARDAQGNSTTATSLQITVSNPDTTPPVVAITSPVNGFTATGTISVMASATDNQAMAGVQFLLDGASLGSEVLGAGPAYSFIWDTTTTTNGPHVLTARARDGANLTTTSTAINLTVSNGDTTPPTVAVTSPAAGSVLAGTVTITVSATDNVAMAGVQFLLDGANLGTEVLGAGPTYTFSWNTTTVTNGSHTLSARGRDVTNNTAVATNVNVTASNQPSGRLASYSFNAGSGTTTVDSSGNGLTGTIHGATWTTGGKYGSALSFNGTNNYVDLANPASLKATGSMTWTAWVKASSTPATDGNIVAKQNASSGWQLKTSADTGTQTFAVAVSGSSGTALRYSNTVPSPGTWYHVAGVYNATTHTLDIYINGVLDDGVLRGTIPTKQTIPNVNVNIGRRSTGLYFPGVIDEVQIYGRALSATEVQGTMSTPLP